MIILVLAFMTPLLTLKIETERAVRTGPNGYYCSMLVFIWEARETLRAAQTPIMAKA
ncbi:MAG: hypothetical protein A4E57_03077 [Syntrophorhabdaceae bacterium PtaU1.Bin034]|nr:MAG: hypothetical protein A4E57_03077 [Syntrophorhabdaceae bacterium PtaU1.Bin034]